MKVIDSENWAWFLFEYQSHLYLDAYCSMSAFGYTYMIRLNAEECASYAARGHDYLNELAHDIHYSVPIAKNTKSKFKGRDVSKLFSEMATEAVQVWREAKGGE